jgi:hypothetical protein
VHKEEHNVAEKRVSQNNQVLAHYSEKAKQYGLTLDEFLDEVKAGQIRVIRTGGELHFERDEPLFELTGSEPKGKKARGSVYPD